MSVVIGTRRGVLIDALLPRRSSFMRDVLLVVGFGSVMGLLAQAEIRLPFDPVPITGQTFGLLLFAALLGGRRGALAMLTYLAEGLVGLPVFAGGLSAWSPSSAGVPVIVGPTAGYLFALPLAALAVGALAERGWDRSLPLSLLAMLAGEVIVYLIGVPWLAHYVGPQLAIPFGLQPFMLGDALKLALAAVCLPFGWFLVGKATRGSVK